MSRDLSDPILLELVKNGLDAIVDEMAIALVRTAYSNSIRNKMPVTRWPPFSRRPTARTWHGNSTTWSANLTTAP